MVDPALETLWKHVLDHWEDDKAHAVFLEHCQRTEQLLEAAVRYRGMGGDHQRGPAATKRLHAITYLALAKLDAQRASERPARSRSSVALIALFLLGSLLLILALTGLPG